jgi:hypothetical protein
MEVEECVKMDVFFNRFFTFCTYEGRIAGKAETFIG